MTTACRAGKVAALTVAMALTSATPVSADSTANDCAVTIPTGRASRYGTFGIAYLGTTPAADGVLRARATILDSTTACHFVLLTELSWWRWRGGALEVTGRRLDETAPPLHAVVKPDRGEMEAQRTPLVFPTPGCWEITGRLGGGELTFVTRVEAAPPPLPRPTPPKVEPRYRSYTAQQQRAFALRPMRRDGPLRELNISADEIREIQSVLGPNIRPEMLNIAGVVTGCPCEDGPGCREQVWVVTWRGQRSSGLLFSRIDGRWTLGPVQRWWIQREAIDAKRGEMGMLAYMKAIEALDAKLPQCDREGGTP